MIRERPVPEGIGFFQRRNMKYHLHWPGGRILKTAAATAICFAVGYALHFEAARLFYAAIAAIISLKTNIRETRSAMIFRLEATACGGALGFVVLKTQQWFGWHLSDLKYFLLLLVAMVLLMWILSIFRRDGAISVSCVVLFSIAINHTGDENVANFALERFLGTAIGVLAAFFVEAMFPYRAKKNT